MLKLGRVQAVETPRSEKDEIVIINVKSQNSHQVIPKRLLRARGKGRRHQSGPKARKALLRFELDLQVTAFLNYSIIGHHVTSVTE